MSVAELRGGQDQELPKKNTVEAASAKKYILWDNDGVLVDTEQWYFKATQRALEELGVNLDKETYLKRMAQGISSWNLASQAGIGPERIAAKQQQRNTYYEAYLTQETIELPDVERVLAELAADKMKMAIVTTSRRQHFDLIHRNKNLLRFMDFVLTREDYTLSKPNPEPYLLGLSRFGARADECLVVEDSQRGLQAAIAAKIDCVVIHNAFTSTHDFTGATHLLNSIHDLPEIVKGWR